VIAEKKSSANKGLGAGLLLGFIGGAISASAPEIGLLVSFAAIGAWLWGCSQYAEAKGYHAAFGLFGLATILGLIVLAVLPDKHKNTSNEASG
jgi:hypothetical protein